jgi:CRP/FNR family transcriptional regulator, cyclic AMP receptor protein
MDDKNILKLIPYFSTLSPAELDAVYPLCSIRKITRGDMVIHAGEASSSLFIVVSGAIKIFITSLEGREQVVNVIYPGQAINDMAFFDREANAISAQALNDAVLCQISRPDLDAIMRKNGRVAHNIILSLARRLRQMLLLIEDLSFKRVINRLARVLLENATEGAAPGRRLTQQEMANMVGTAREVVSRSLRVMEDAGTIEIVQHRIVIRDRDGLRNLAQAAACD